jgi:hypothetical protein
MYYIPTKFVLHVTNNLVQSGKFWLLHFRNFEPLDWNRLMCPSREPCFAFITNTCSLILQCLMNIRPNFICSLPIGRDWHCKASSLMESGNLQSKSLLPPFDNPMAMWFALMMLPLLDIAKWSILLTPIHQAPSLYLASQQPTKSTSASK